MSKADIFFNFACYLLNRDKNDESLPAGRRGLRPTIFIGAGATEEQSLRNIWYNKILNLQSKIVNRIGGVWF